MAIDRNPHFSLRALMVSTNSESIRFICRRGPITRQLEQAVVVLRAPRAPSVSGTIAMYVGIYLPFHCLTSARRSTHRLLARAIIHHRPGVVCC